MGERGGCWDDKEESGMMPTVRHQERHVHGRRGGLGARGGSWWWRRRLQCGDDVGAV